MLLLRALFFLNSLVGGGAERVCLNLARQLYQLNIESDFITIYNRQPDYEIPDYIHVFSLAIANKTGEWIEVIKAVPKVNIFLSDKKYVLITAHVQPSHLLASLTKVGNKSLYVVHSVVEYGSWREKLFYKLFYKNKKIVAVSKGVEDEWKQEYGLRSEDVATIYNPGGISYLKSKPQFGLPHSRPYILVMGRLVDEKNPLLALELYYRGQFYQQYDLIFLGKGFLEGCLKEQIIKYDMQEHVFLMGFQKNPAQWLMHASLLLSCSKKEGLPMNLIEALGFGIPVVAADCPCGPNEILTDELAKYLIHPEQDQNESISIISSALVTYPAITKQYYEKFEDGLIAETYLKTWKHNFG